jgi:deoxyribonuclease V
MWPTSHEELIATQRELATWAPPIWRPDRAALSIGACVVCFPRGQSGRGERGDPAWSAAAVVRGHRVIADATLARQAAGAPYSAGMLALREGPCLEDAVRALSAQPDVLLVDATGRDHPRRAGLAVHLGAVLDLPTVGVTHRPLLAAGVWPDDVTGASSPLTLDGERVGAWLRTRAGARPLAVHAGWRTEVDVAVEIVFAAVLSHRTPEPFRHARMLARLARAGDPRGS